MTQHVRVAILGAGMSGLCMAIQLKKHGIESFLVFEKADRVGGTWRENVYPGVACDVPSHLYSYSFALNPSWSRRYPPGSEIQSYIESCVDKFGLTEYIHYGTEVKRVQFDGSHWKISFDNGEDCAADVVVSGLGGLHVPNVPAFDGLESYNGAFFHTAEWNSDIDLKDKTVAIVGTGASAIQVLPEIQQVAKKIDVFQRTPPWIVPRNDRATSNRFKKWATRIPFLARLRRWLIYSLMELRGGFVKKDSRMNRIVTAGAKAYLKALVRDDDLRKALTPTYAAGCKRILVSDDYYWAIQQENVELIPQPVKAFNEDGIVTEDDVSRKFDVVIAATGFEPFAINSAVEFVGRDGIRIDDCWSDRVESYRTVMVPNFPNLFMLLGPNSGLGHNSVIFMIETQVRFVLRALRTIERVGASRMEPRSDATKQFNEDLRQGLDKTVYGGGCHAWYTDDEDHNFTLWPYSTIRYYLSMRRFRRDEFVWEK